MNRTFNDLLAELRPDADAIQLAARFYLAETTGDLSPVVMRERLLDAANQDESKVDPALAELESDSIQVEAGCLTLLAGAWEDPAEHEAIRGALTDAKAQMPIIETAIIASVVAYGMYLLATQGKKRFVRVKRRGIDGSIEEIEAADYESPDAALRAIMTLGQQVD